MKNERFSYLHDEKGVHIEANQGDVLRLAGEVSYLIHQLYNIILRRDPQQAAMFRRCIILGNADDSPQWGKDKEIPGTVDICLLTSKTKEEAHETES